MIKCNGKNVQHVKGYIPFNKTKVIQRLFRRVIFSGRFIMQTFLNTQWAYLSQVSDTGVEHGLDLSNVGPFLHVMT